MRIRSKTYLGDLRTANLFERLSDTVAGSECLLVNELLLLHELVFQSFLSGRQTFVACALREFR